MLPTRRAANNMAHDELIRPSRDGDQFHYLWAARQCLALLPSAGDLVAVSIEGASTSEGTASVDDGDELIDVGLYHGSESLKDARLVHYTQLKHSTKHAHEPWTASGLAKTLKGFGKRYAELLNNLPAQTLKDKFRFSFTSNRPIDPKVREALEDLGSGATAPRQQKVQDTLLGYTELSAIQAQDFFQIFSADGGEPDLWAQRNLLAQDLSIYLADSDYDTPVQLKELVARKATSEFKGDPAIRRHDVLRALKVSEVGLLPAPCLIVAPARVLPREQEAEILQALLGATHPVVLHADGGAGKSVLALRLTQSMPAGSIAVLYDCFGDGLYRNSLHFRHRHCDALVQIANELAAQGLCHPLIPSASADGKHFMRAFVGRLKQAIGLLRARDAQASLCIVIDAADNADMAAEEHGDAAFVRDLIRTPLPDGVKLAFTCRTHRRLRLAPPPDAIDIEVRRFSLAETTMHLRRAYPQATDTEATEFAFLSSNNPRVQALAISRHLPIDQMLKELGPTPSTIDRAIGDLLKRAIEKLKDQVGQVESAQIELICQGLAVLRPLVPISVLAQISGTPEGAVRSFAYDLGRPLLVKGGSLHFLDEPSETWFREQFKPDAANLVAFLKRLRPLAASSSYVASTLPQLLLTAGLMDELVELALSEEGLPTSNPLERRDVEIQRLTFALKACLQKGRYAAAAKLALKVGGESAGETRQTSLIQDNTDIAAALLSADRIDELVSRRTFGSSWVGSHHAYDAGLLSGRAEFLAEAGSRLRMAEDWLYAWARLPPDERHNEPVDDSDQAEMALAHLRVRGPESAAEFLSGWKPRHVALPASKRLARRLVDLGQYEQLDALAAHAAKYPWVMLGLSTEASLAGHALPAEPLAQLMRDLAAEDAKPKHLMPWDARWDVLVAVTAAIWQALRVLPREDVAWADILRRHLPDNPPTELASQFGSDCSSLPRAYALEAALRGEKLSLLAVAPPKVRKDLEGKGTYGRSSETVTFERAIGGVLPWFVLWAEIACGRIPSDLGKAIADALKVTASAASQDYQHLFNVERVAAIEWTRALRDASATDHASVALLQEWIASKQSVLSSETLTSMCRIAARTKGLQDLALESAIAGYALLEDSREDAEAETDAYQRLARAVYPASSAEAAAYFNRAVEISSRIGEENLVRWSALLHLATVSGKGDHARPRSAYRLARTAELAYTYVARDKHFDWRSTVDALVGLCPTSALAILSRWRDRDFGFAARLVRLTVYSLVRVGRLPPFAPVALAPLEAEWDGLADVSRAIDAEADPDRRRKLLELRYRYMRVEPHSEETWAGFLLLGRTHGVDLPDVDRLLAAAKAESVADSAAKSQRADRTYGPLEPVQRRDPDWDQLFAGVDLADSAALRKAYADMRTFDPPYQLEEFYRQGLERSGPGRMADFVRAVAAWPDFGVFELSYLMSAPQVSGVKLVSFVEALRVATLAACRNTPQYAQRDNWERIFPFERLVAGGIVTDEQVVDAILQGYTTQIATLNARELFLMLDPLASRLTPDEADDVLNFGMSLLEDVLRPNDGDGPWRDGLMPPTSCDEALAGYLWVVLGSPAAASRWEAAHVVRICVELGWTGLLAALAARASAGTAAPFVDEGLKFYEWHARQWLLIGLARGVLEQPAAVVPFIPFLSATAREEHVAIRHFAAKALKALHAAGLVPGEEVADLDAVNTSRLPLALYSGWREISPENETPVVHAPKDEDKYYFGYDFGQYWFAPLGRVFGIDEDSVEQRAREALRERIGEPLTREDVRYKRGIFRHEETRHSHGSLPRVDDLSAYQAYHAIMIVAARLLASRPVGKDEGDEKNDLEEWLQYRLLTRDDGRWVADRRDPCLTEPAPRPQSYGDKQWCWSVTADYLDRQVLTDDGLQVLHGYWTSGHRDDHESVSIRSALVPEVGAAALLAALQTAPESERSYIPSSDTPEPPGPGAFRMTAWLTTAGASVGLDKYDPWGEKLDYPAARPDPAVVQRLSLTSFDDGRRWLTPNGSVLRTETWTRVVGQGQEQEVVAGTRLSAERRFLLDFLKAHPSSRIVVSVSVRRQPTRSRSDEDDFDGYAWPYVRYYLIGEDGIARSLKSRD
jgi:hypothetical protein